MEINMPLLGIVVPCYNEEEVLPVTDGRISEILDDQIKNNRINRDSFIAYVDDGSRDKTWKIIEERARGSKNIKGLKLSKNYGHQYALLAGLNTFRDQCDCIISIDADLQDDIAVIDEMIKKYKEGNEIVYGVRKKRRKDSFFKRTSARFFYRLMHMMGVNIIFNHADYRLVSKKALIELDKFGESNLFLRGIFPLIGFNQDTVYYDRKERFAGESKYPLRKMIGFALDGISSYSIKPLRLISFIGFIIFFISIILSIYSLVSYFSRGTVPGWTSISLPLYFLSGIQLLSIGIIGEYLGKIYKEVKRRPRYIVEKVIS